MKTYQLNAIATLNFAGYEFNKVKNTIVFVIICHIVFRIQVLIPCSNKKLLSMSTRASKALMERVP